MDSIERLGSSEQAGLAQDSFPFPLVLLRHGQSTWNRENRFTGWTDVELSRQGLKEAGEAARRLVETGFSFDLAFTSVLSRAIDTLSIVLEAMRLEGIPIVQRWELNERHYGALQGLNKAETARRLGEERVMSWRRSYAARPPALEWDDQRHPRFDSRYATLPAEMLPRTESLADTERRLLPCWQGEIAAALRAGRRILISAHGNSLRALVRYLENVPEAKVPGINIPTGIPLVYELDVDLHPIRRYDLTDLETTQNV
jgi:2,3-bisphosphoglycerate-dependent phosphoglycerate mutase